MLQGIFIRGAIIAIIITLALFVFYKFVVTPIKRQAKTNKEFNIEGKSFSIGEKVRLKYFPNVEGVVVYANTLTGVYTVGMVDSNNHYYTETFYPRHLSKYGNANN